jgi:hypothetical protein
MRTALTTAMAVILMAALFWGNCYSCPQLLLAQQKHGCCPHSKQTSSDCQTQALRNFVKAEKSSAAVPAAICRDWQPVILDRDSITKDDREGPPTFATPPLRTSLRI